MTLELMTFVVLIRLPLCLFLKTKFYGVIARRAYPLTCCSPACPVSTECNRSELYVEGIRGIGQSRNQLVILFFWIIRLKRTTDKKDC
jgi:hypothetical protein